MSPSLEPDMTPSPGGEALVGLAHASTRLHPDDIPATVAAHARSLGLDEISIYLADLEQVELLPFAAPGVEPGAPLPIDGDGAAGLAYRREQPVLPSATDDDQTLWVPLLDSAERMGVVAMRGPGAANHELRTLRAYVDLIAETIANKSTYGDVITRTRRLRPLTVAAEFRWSMLPPLTFKGRNMTISGVLEPAYSIAGDTFDYAVNGNTLHTAIFDAVGHGLEAARIANLAVAGYRHSRRADADTPAAYRAIDALVGEQFGAEKFVTAQLVRLELDTGVMCWVNAGHPHPMLVRGGRARDLDSHICLPLGMADAGRVEPAMTEVQLEPGDAVLFFTDGVVELRSEHGEEFGRSRLAALLERATAAGETTAETLRVLGHAVMAHHGLLQDDATMVLVSWHGPSSATL